MAKRRILIPDRKISETFLEFAAPLLCDLGTEVPEHRIHEALKVCFAAWNAVVLADVLDDHRFLEEIRRLTAGQPAPTMLTEQMIARKRAFFSDDARLIGDWQVTPTPNGINVRVEARDPRSIKRES
jgi:hypothetical protein